MENRDRLVNREKIMEGVKLILEGIGADLGDQDFQETPRRIADFFEELLSNKLTAEDYKYFSRHGDIVVVVGVRAYGLCPHHLLPVEYIVDLAYIPENNVVGISKLIRAVLEEARFPKLQEKFTEDIATRLIDLTGSANVLVSVRGRHFCMVMRGVKSNAIILTTTRRGRFEDNRVFQETLDLIKTYYAISSREKEF